MKIKVNQKNAAKIEAALAQANGRATAHTFSKVDQMLEVVASAERQLAALLSVKDRTGAIYSATSGDRVANSYNYGRAATAVAFQRGSKDWFLVSANAVQVSSFGGGADSLKLSVAQDAAAIERTRKHYSILQLSQSSSMGG